MASTILQTRPSPDILAEELDEPQAERRPYGKAGREVDDAAGPLNYVEVTPLKLSACPEDIQVVEINAYTQEDLYELGVQTRGELYASAEGLDAVDFNWSELDAEYQEMGLRHYRRAWLALDRESGRSLGALIAHRGPAGCNFGLLENRADLLVSEEVEDERLEDVVVHLISAATETYDDFSPGFIPLATDDRAARVLRLRGDRRVGVLFGERDTSARTVHDDTRHRHLAWARNAAPSGGMSVSVHGSMPTYRRRGADSRLSLRESSAAFAERKGTRAACERVACR